MELEWKTRKLRIDQRLKAQGWQTMPWIDGLAVGSLSGVAVTEFPTANGPADYALFVDGRPLAILEAKKVTVNPQNVLEQAKRYAEGVFAGVGNWDGLRVPFLYASNGTLLWHLDVRPSKRVSREIADFDTPAALAERFAQDFGPADIWLQGTSTALLPRLRPYQSECILATENALRAGRREMLLALATGTGKTYLTVKIGLTATPAAHTVGLFGQPVFRYTVEQAILIKPKFAHCAEGMAPR